MTKKLQDFFQLPEDDITQESDLMEPIVDYDEVTETAFSNLEKIEAALPAQKSPYPK